MNDYVTLDGYKYRTVFGQWTPVFNKPTTVRYPADGTLDVNYGETTYREWAGLFSAPITSEGVGWGTYTTLKASILKNENLSYIDHEDATVHSVAILGGFEVKSRTPDLYGASNKLYMMMRLLKV
jgi:hypothetical protein